MTAENEFYPSIFNDVLAPETQGPSSSNTVGPYRIGKIARALLRGKPERLEIEMSEKGGYAATFYSMESDKAFLQGVLGRDLIKDDLAEVYAAAEAAGLEYKFFFSDKLEREPTEMAKLVLSSEEESVSLVGVTLGGGEILIRELNGRAAEIRGRREEEISLGASGEVRILPSVYPLAVKKGAKPPFSTSAEMLEYAAREGKELWQAALDYECSLTGLSEAEVFRVAESTLEKAYRSMDEGYKPGVAFEGVTKAKAPEFKAALRAEKHELIPSGISDEGALDAIAIMEYSNSHGIIVCMPTGGASGVIPAAIRSAAKSLGKSREDEVRALLAAGLIGVFYYPTHYHGALGCQAEVGVATSEAAAALVSLVSGSAEAAERAAVLAIQYLLGQVCDPLEGYAQIPCFIRNAASVSVAATCANCAILGIDTAVSLDEMVGAVLRVGEALKAERINDLGTCACRAAREAAL